MLKIKNLSVKVGDKVLLKDFNLHVKKGEVHVIMGPNGAGKSTLAKVIAGFPGYEVIAGSIFYNGEDLLALTPEERARKKLFVSFQYPLEISGITNFDFLFTAYNKQQKANNKEALNKKAFEILLDEKMKELEIRKEFKKRSINDGFSGGEKKKNEILQMALFNPALSILDEIDSGLDVDALKKITEILLKLRAKDNSYVFITHYPSLLDYINVDFVHILSSGKLIKTGDLALAEEIGKKGFASFVGSK